MGTMQSLDPSGMSKAVITFQVPRNASSLTAFEFCNKHGLWKGPTVQVQTTNLDESESPNVRIAVIILSVVGLAMLFGVVGGLAYYRAHALGKQTADTESSDRDQKRNTNATQ